MGLQHDNDPVHVAGSRLSLRSLLTGFAQISTLAACCWAHVHAHRVAAVRMALPGWVPAHPYLALTGHNHNEPYLSPSTVGYYTFGMVGKMVVDDAVRTS